MEGNITYGYVRDNIVLQVKSGMKKQDLQGKKMRFPTSVQSLQHQYKKGPTKGSFFF